MEEVVLDDASLWLTRTDSEPLPYNEGSAMRDIHLVAPYVSADSLPVFKLDPRGKKASLETDRRRSGLPLLSGFSHYNPQLNEKIKLLSKNVDLHRCILF